LAPSVLARLRIENLAVIESAELELGAGLTAITGETGAGKSILVGGLELALGARAGGEIIRAGARRASAEAVFGPPFPPEVARRVRGELGLEWSPEEALELRREIPREGRGRAFIAGQQVAVADLAALGELLVDLHGQHEHQSLFRRPAQRAALDAYGACEALLETYRRRYAEHEELKGRQRALLEAARGFEERLDFLTFQISELEGAAARPGELAELEAEERRLTHAETLAEAAARVYGLLYEGASSEAPPALAALGEAARALGRIAELDPAMSDLPARAEEIKALLEDLALAVRDYAERCAPDPRRLEAVIERIETLRRLLRKHGVADEAGLLDKLAALREARAGMTQDDEERGQIEPRLKAAAAALQAEAERLSARRQEAARRLARLVTRTIGKVGMEKARFEIAVRPMESFGPDGGDEVEFLLGANPGEGMNPLREVVSGGELSRTMLALKTALARRDAIPTLIFDEVDAGIGGETAAAVGRLLADLAASHQIVCITHHASIAARAERHLSVRKATAGGRTRGWIVRLDREARLEELARLMGGKGAGPAGRRLAERLLGQRG